MQRAMSLHSFPPQVMAQSQGTGSSQPPTPSASGMNDSNSPVFDFPVPAIPPRLSKVGRRISELGSSILYPEDEPPRRTSRDHKRVEVPGMGDEPVMCPFCNKPLPPALFDKHVPTKHGSATPEKRGSLASLRGLGIKTGDLSRSLSIGPGAMGEGAFMAATAGGSPGYMSHRSSLTKTLVEEPTDMPVVPESKEQAVEILQSAKADTVPKATAESLQPTVQAAEGADTAAAKSLISRDELRRWSVIAGMPVSPDMTKKEEQIPPDAKEPEKSIPALPPPPPPASAILKSTPDHQKTASGGSSSRFGFFRRGSKGRDPANEDDESDDEGMQGSGYAKLTGPASPDKEYDEDPMDGFGKAKSAKTKSEDTAPPSEEKAKEEQPAGEKKEAPAIAEPPVADGNGANDAQLKGTLQEVIGKVNAMSKAHEDIVHSHATLLTQLKIARSNLAMAEANTEMLEEQLKRTTRKPSGSTPAASGPGTVIATPGGITAMPPVISPTISRKSLDAVPTVSGLTPASNTANGAAAPATRSVSPGPTGTGSADAAAKQRASLEAPRPTPMVSPQPRRAAESPEKALRPRPNTLIMPPPNMNNNGPSTSVAGENKGWSFWQGGKKKIPGMGNMKFTLPTADQIFDAIDVASRPSTPSVERQAMLSPTSGPNTGSLTSPPGGWSSNLPVGDVTSPPPRGGSTVASPSLARSTSSSAVVSPAMRAKAPMSPPDYMGEMNRMRQAQLSNQQRIEAMSKELAELRKGKVDMEAELENLSQALFEEANKMVAEERRKRAEVEESLKEIKEEREALRQTIKVMNGQTGEGDNESVKAPSIKIGGGSDDEDIPDEFVPRDLDKHYEALRKTIHHVGESAGGSSADAFGSAVLSNDYSIRDYAPDEPPIPEGREIDLASVASEADSEGRPRARSISAPTSPNPWAANSEPMTGGGGLALGEDIDPLDSGAKIPITFGSVGVTPPIGDVGPVPAAAAAAAADSDGSKKEEEEEVKESGVKGLGLKLSATPPSESAAPTEREGEAKAVEGEVEGERERPKNERKMSQADELDKLMGDLSKVM